MSNTKSINRRKSYGFTKEKAERISLKTMQAYLKRKAMMGAVE